MFKISTRGQYALMIMTYLGQQNSESYISLKTLAARHGLSPKYLEQIMIQLSKAELVAALRGNNGGYKLIRPAEKYTAGEILRVMEGDLSPKSTTQTMNEDKGNKKFWENFEKAINGYVDSVTLEDIVDENRTSDNEGYLYYI